MDAFKKIYASLQTGCFTPVYYPNETYSFFINTDYWLTDPDYDFFQLCVIDVEGNVQAIIGGLPNTGTSPLRRILGPGGSGGEMSYKIFAFFTFPELAKSKQASGTFYFAIKNAVSGAEVVRSNPFLYEHTGMENTVRIWFRNKENRNNYHYADILSQTDILFYNMFRVPMAQLEINNESEIETYRATSDNKFRTISSYLEKLYKNEFFNLNEDAFKALSEMLECDEVVIDFAYVTKKTQLNTDINSATNLLKANFECYINQETFPEGSHYLYGQYILMSGNATYAPIIIYDQNI